jgi:hypothetical protein
LTAGLIRDEFERRIKDDQQGSDRPRYIKGAEGRPTPPRRGMVVAPISEGTTKLLGERADMTHVRPVISPRRETLSPRG